ncbi:hypothetical protein [Rhizobium sp. MHM7A]|nr:hypothetical protein [Rhizobium sp. MHM7A]
MIKDNYPDEYRRTDGKSKVGKIKREIKSAPVLSVRARATL